MTSGRSGRSAQPDRATGPIEACGSFLLQVDGDVRPLMSRTWSTTSAPAPRNASAPASASRCVVVEVHGRLRRRRDRRRVRHGPPPSRPRRSERVRRGVRGSGGARRDRRTHDAMSCVARELSTARLRREPCTGHTCARSTAAFVRATIALCLMPPVKYVPGEQRPGSRTKILATLPVGFSPPSAAPRIWQDAPKSRRPTNHTAGGRYGSGRLLHQVRRHQGREHRCQAQGRDRHRGLELGRDQRGRLGLRAAAQAPGRSRCRTSTSR